MTIYYSPPNELAETDEVTERALEFIPESDAALVGVLDEMGTPTTVDEVTDQLIRPAQPSIDTWATVHEKLHQDRLPELDTSGYIEFDRSQGMIECQTSYASTESRLPSAMPWSSLRTVSVVLATLIALAAVAVLALAIVTGMVSIPSITL
ncbi:hypothetical protein [Natronorubrum sulfidifaciens]|uniref:Uncharacterized protein n=1 Tax=Natronorubrum sulfidifaciens JCM 14089 TaxID=1230460 RepID=L9W5C3_9EURY|nr:hypothetical protein [Natronorubrum sulfidifaciens]ELY44542.1 hypothetical protein C495_11594 [Natronorubrum sulfidifaciens JCM 14089]